MRYSETLRVALKIYRDRFLILSLGLIVSVFGVVTILESRGPAPIPGIYLVSSSIMAFVVLAYWVLSALNRAKAFKVEVFGTALDICGTRIYFADIKQVYATPRGDLVVVVGDATKYHIYKNVKGFDDASQTLAGLGPIGSKSETKERIAPAVNLLLFSVFIFVSLSYIVVPIGVYLVFIVGKELVQGILLKSILAHEVSAGVLT